MSEESLLEAVKKDLAKSGQLKDLKGRVRATLCSSLLPNEQATPPDHAHSEMDELVYEYLMSRGCFHTANLLRSECGLEDAVELRRCSLLASLGMADSPRSAGLPVLVALWEHFKSQQNNHNAEHTT